MTSTLERTPLSSALKEHTAQAHETAENTGFMTALLDGKSGPDALVALLAQQLPIYSALESACAANSADPRLASILDARLDRTAALRADLAAHAAAGRTCDVVLPSTQAYVDELTAATGSAPALVGHHYVRYLGDLSGGQIIDRLVRRHYDMTDGLSFYAFDIEKPKVFKDQYRAALDALPLTEAEHDASLAAAVRAFELNTRIFRELDEHTTAD